MATIRRTVMFMVCVMTVDASDDVGADYETCINRCSLTRCGELLCNAKENECNKKCIDKYNKRILTYSKVEKCAERCKEKKRECDQDINKCRIKKVQCPTDCRKKLDERCHNSPEPRALFKKCENGCTNKFRAKEWSWGDPRLINCHDKCSRELNERCKS